MTVGDLFLQKLVATEFKNYELQALEPGRKLNFLLGDNGGGKTNLLDAIYFLCMGKSYFQATDRFLVRTGGDFFRLEGVFERMAERERIVAKYKSGDKKILERNQVPYDRLSEHVGLLPVVIIAPDDVAIAMEGSEERRRFLDNTLCQLQPTYLQQLLVYNKVLHQRNALLKSQEHTGRIDPALLEVYEAQLLGPADYIHQARTNFLEALLPVFLAYQQQIARGREMVGCTYRSPLQQAPLEQLFAENREKDLILQRTSVGIHKDDLVFTINDKPIKRFASQGQRKTYILALKLAQYELLRSQKGLQPILLLDDLFDRLDPHRVRQLLQLILDGPFGQVFISDTDTERLPAIAAELQSEYRTFIIQKGMIQDAE